MKKGGRYMILKVVQAPKTVFEANSAKPTFMVR